MKKKILDLMLAVRALFRFINFKIKIEMTKEILTSENLIEIHDNLNEFAKHHQNIGGQKAHKLIKSELIDKDKIRDGSENMKRWYEGYDAAMKQVLSLLYQTFVP